MLGREYLKQVTEVGFEVHTSEIIEITVLWEVITRGIYKRPGRKIAPSSPLRSSSLMIEAASSSEKQATTRLNGITYIAKSAMSR
jgi:hypothetical protein